MSDVNTICELFRELSFSEGKGLGCYQNFELTKDFKEKLLIHKEILEEFRDTKIEEIQCYTNRIWNIYWSWASGNGILIFELGNYYYVNNDCKKDNRWIKKEFKNKQI